MFKKHSNKEVEKVHLKDDFSEEDYKNDQIQLQVKSSEYVNFSFNKMIKYSEVIQEEINKNDIIKKIEQEIQKIKKTTNIKDENIKTFFQIINEEEVEINNDQYSDLFKLSAVFKIKALKKFLSKYAKSHSKDIDFIIIQIQENTNEVSENNENSSELEKCLIAKINECFTNEKFNELPISIVYRIIKESSSSKEIDSNLLYDFIKRKKEERYVLFGFLSLHNMNDDKFNDLYQDYLNDQKSKEIKYYEYLRHNIKLIKQLKDDKKSLENQIKNLRINNEQLQIQMSQINEENQQLKTANQRIQEQMTQSNNENQEFMKKISQMNKENQQLKTENQKIQEQMTQSNNENQEFMKKIKEENQQLREENQKINKNNEQLQMKIAQMNEENKKIKTKKEGQKFEFDGQANHRFNGIIHHLQGSDKTNICDRGIINVTASTYQSNYFPKNAVDFDKENYYWSYSRNDWLKYDFKEKKIRPTHYSIRTSKVYNAYNPINWVIEVSSTNKDNDWRVIDSRTGVTSVSKVNQSDTFDISTRLSDNEYYRYIRFRCDGDTSNDCTWLVISSLEYFGYLIE